MMKTLIFSTILCCVIALPAVAELTPEELDIIREIADTKTDIIGDQLNFIFAFLIIGIYLPNIAKMYETNKEYQYKKLENRIQTLEQGTDKETQ